MAHSYWRLYSTNVQGGGGAFGLVTLEMHATVGGADLCTGGTALSDSNFAGVVAAYAFDANTATTWTSLDVPGPHWVGYHFATTVDVVEIRIVSRSDYLLANTTTFEVQWSNDGITWSAQFGEVLVPNWTAGEARVYAMAAGQEQVGAVAMHTVVGGTDLKEAAAALVQHTVHGASPSESWVAAVAMHSVRGGDDVAETVDLVVMHTVVAPDVFPPIDPVTGDIAQQRITVSVDVSGRGGTGGTTAGATQADLDAEATARMAADAAEATARAAGDAAAVQRVNHTGTQSADTLTDGTTNKAFLATERTKLAGIATGATANSSDATLLARANHTGTQLAATISDFASTARAETEAELVAGTGITITPSGSGASRQLTFASSGGAAPAMVRIDRQTPSGVSSVTLTPSGSYDDMRVRVFGRGSASALFVSLQLQFNGDTGANYDYEFMDTAATAASANQSFAATSINVGYLAAATASSGSASLVEILIASYAGTTLHKAVNAFGGLKEGTSSGQVFITPRSGWWRNTAAITSIVVSLSSGNFAAGSIVSLYGIL